MHVHKLIRIQIATQLAVDGNQQRMDVWRCECSGSCNHGRIHRLASLYDNVVDNSRWRRVEMLRHRHPTCSRWPTSVFPHCNQNWPQTTLEERKVCSTLKLKVMFLAIWNDCPWWRQFNQRLLILRLTFMLNPWSSLYANSLLFSSWRPKASSRPFHEHEIKSSRTQRTTFRRAER